MILGNVLNAISKYRLIEKGDRIVIGVSGGPDSVALLYVLNALRQEFDLGLHVAHLDHKLRKDSIKDRLFVEMLCRRLKLSITVEQAHVARMAKKGGSLEEIARNARLRFFFKVAKKYRAKKIALAHTFDDQAETVLMRVLRGSGLYGLAGILPKRKMGDFEIIRPLLETRRRAINAYLLRIKITPRIDTTNASDIYFRNKVRNRLIPLLEKEYNPNIKNVLSAMAQTAGYDYDYLASVALRLMGRMGQKMRLDRLLKLHPALRRLLMRLHIARVSGNTRRITFQHIVEIEDLLFNRPLNSVVDLPKGVSVVKKKAYLWFYKRK